MTDLFREPMDVAALLRDRAQNEWGDEVTTDVTVWEDGDYEVEVYHTWVTDLDGIEYHGDAAAAYDGPVRKRWYESWVRDRNGNLYWAKLYQHGEGAKGSKERLTDSEHSITL